MLIARKLAALRSGGGGGGGGTFTPMRMGYNLSEVIAWYDFQHPFVDISQSQSISCVGTTVLSTTGDTTSGSRTISNLASTTGLVVGMKVTGTGIINYPTRVIAIAGNSVTLSAAASTGSGVGTALSFTFDGIVVPDNYRDAAGWPNAYPPGVTNFQFLLCCPVAPGGTPEAYNFTWSATSYNGTFTWFHLNGSPGTQGANSQQITPWSLSQAFTNSGTTFCQYTLGTGDHPTNFSCRPVADPGGICSPTFKSQFALLKGTGPLRVTRMTTVENNGNPYDYPSTKYPVNGDLQLRDPILTSSTRNTLTRGAEWWDRRDGPPFEFWVSVANELGTDLWYPINWNSDSTYWTDLANYAAAHLTGKLYIELSNEIWNGNYVVCDQVVNEANYRGQTGQTWSDSTCKTSCRVVSQTNLTLTGAATIDGVAVSTGDRVLAAGQTTGSQNGVYVANTAGAWTRATDADATGEILFGDKWFITAGTSYINSTFFVATPGTITVGTTAISIKQFLAHHMQAEKSAKVWAPFESAYTAKRSSLVNMLCRQNANGGTPNYFTEMLAYPNVLGHVDGLSTATYFNPVGYAAGYTGPDSAATVIASAYHGALYSVDGTLDSAVANKAPADLNGLTYQPYEGGFSTSFTDLTETTSVNTDPAIRLLIHYGLNEHRRRGIPGLNYFNMGYPLAAGSDQGHGLLSHINDPIDATNPKALGAHQQMLGNYELFDPNFTSAGTVYDNAASGTLAATADKGLLAEASYSLSGTGSSNFSVTKATNATNETVGQIKTATANVTAGTYNLSLTQTYTNPVTGVQTKTTAFSIVVTAFVWSPSAAGVPLSLWFEASTSSCFTDTAGTVAVVNDGDLVACIRSKSAGNAIIATQGTSGNRPAYRLGAGKPYLDFSSGTASLNGTGNPSLIDASGQHSGAAACYFTANGANQTVIDYGRGANLGNPLVNNAGTAQSKTISSPSAVTDSGPSIALNTWLVISELTSTTSVEAFVNGTGNGSTSLGANTLPTGTPSNCGVGNVTTCRIPGFAMYKGVLSGTDHANLVTYLQGLH